MIKKFLFKWLMLTERYQKEYSWATRWLWGATIPAWTSMFNLTVITQQKLKDFGKNKFKIFICFKNTNVIKAFNSWLSTQ
jgi:hypothetical protein